jgi:hypothetical protein
MPIIKAGPAHPDHLPAADRLDTDQPHPRAPIRRCQYQRTVINLHDTELIDMSASYRTPGAARHEHRFGALRP